MSTYPRIRLSGTELIKRSGIIFSQILNDTLAKIDDGKGEYPKGFFHTSTCDWCTPNYYNQMWARDVGRGINELARLGFVDEAYSAVEYIFSMNMHGGDHWGRELTNPELSGGFELDGNTHLLMGIYQLYKSRGSRKEDAQYFLEKCYPVFNWFLHLIDECPFGDLPSSKSELSGNPDCNFLVYPIFASYGTVVACTAFEEICTAAEDNEKKAQIHSIRGRITASILELLVSRGGDSDQATKTPKGVWLNGLDSRTGKAAEIGDFGPIFDIHRWTRQLPMIQDFDLGYGAEDAKFADTNKCSYEYIKKGMCEGYYFRRYGFVSNTCWSGMGDRHDDTMAGYGQNYFTQAALLNEDVNLYSKCFDGISRLAYDGNVVEHLTPELNPFVMHECFCYKNFEKGLDHTFGTIGDDSRKIMHNPGDEGNLVQSCETLKTYSMMAGIASNHEELIITPRLHWECDEAEFTDFLAYDADGKPVRISYLYKLERYKNLYTVRISGVEAFKSISFRFGPLPHFLVNEEQLIKEGNLLRVHNASYITKTVENNGSSTIEMQLVNER